MKTFRWVKIEDWKGNKIFTLFDVTNYKEKGTILAVGSVVPVGSEFRPIVTYPKTIMTEETMSLSDAKEAVEKKLFDDGIIQDGDTREDTTG